jgi:hypothetical protein
MTPGPRRSPKQSPRWALGAITGCLIFSIIGLYRKEIVAWLPTVATALRSSTFGFVLKLVSGISAAAFGILGIGTKTRDDDGALTRQGKIALIGILVSLFIGAASSVYDFAASQESARVEQQKSQRLLLSVQRALYPLRQTTAVFRVSFHKDFKELSIFKRRLRKAVTADKYCRESNARPFSCRFDNFDDPYHYAVVGSSRLFPRTDSVFGTVLQDMSIRFWIYKESAATAGDAKDGPQYSISGTFLIDPKTHTPERWELVYDYESDMVAMDVLQDELPDSDIFTSEVYSLVDFSPGAIAAAPDILTGASCEDFMRHGIKNCAKEVDDALLELTLDRLQLFFRYPKTLLFDSDSSMQCDYASRHFLTLWLPSDIEATTSKLGQPLSKISPKQARNLCEAMRPIFFGPKGHL